MTIRYTVRVDAFTIRTRYAAVAGLCTLLILVPATLRDTLVYYGLLTNKAALADIVSFLLYLLLQVSYVVYTYGYVLLGKHFRLQSLSTVGYIQVVTHFLYFAAPLALLFLPLQAGYAINTPLNLVDSASELFAGLILVKLRVDLGLLAVLTGVAEMIWALSEMFGIGLGATIGLSGDYLAFPFFLLGTMLLFRASLE